MDRDHVRSGVVCGLRFGLSRRTGTDLLCHDSRHCSWLNENYQTGLYFEYIATLATKWLPACRRLRVSVQTRNTCVGIPPRKGPKGRPSINNTASEVALQRRARKQLELHTSTRELYSLMSNPGLFPATNKHPMEQHPGSPQKARNNISARMSVVLCFVQQSRDDPTAFWA
jgi:hypothetical protein